MAKKRYDKNGLVYDSNASLLAIIWGTWDDFWCNTSISGANNAGRAKNPPYIRRCLWLLLFGFCFYFTLINVLELINNYYQYPVDYSVTVQHKDLIDFPAVTICNQNRVNCERVPNELINCIQDFKKCMENTTTIKSDTPSLNETCWKNNTKCETQETLNLLFQLYLFCECDVNDVDRELPTDIDVILNSVREVSGICGENESGNGNESESNGGKGKGEGRKKRSTSNEINPEDREKEDWEDQGDMDASQEIINAFLGKYMTLPRAIRLSIGHNFTQMVKSCTFRGRSCTNSSYFMPTLSASYGACYTYNSKLNPLDAYASRRKSSLTGPFFGLSIVLNLEQKTYLKAGITKQAGARLAVHEKTLRPLVDEYGYDLMPNVLTEVAIQGILIERQPYPYPSSCFKNWEETNYTNYIEKEWNYTLQQCQRACSHSSILEACGCFHPMFLDKDDEESLERPACNLTNYSNDTTCVERVTYQLDNGIRKCSCGPNCNETDYELFLSQSRWPSTQYTPSATATYGFANIGTDQPGITDDLLQVNVYFKSLNVRTVKETPTYEQLTSSSFISALGGALSLFLGISISMLFEIFEFLFDLIMNICIHLSKGGPKKEKI